MCVCARRKGVGWGREEGVHVGAVSMARLLVVKSTESSTLLCVTDSWLSEEIRLYIVGSVAHFHLRAAPYRCTPGLLLCRGRGGVKPRARGLQLPCSLCFTNGPKCRCHITDALQAPQVLIVSARWEKTAA